MPKNPAYSGYSYDGDMLQKQNTPIMWSTSHTRSTFFADYDYRRQFTRFETISTIRANGSSCISTGCPKILQIQTEFI